MVVHIEAAPPDMREEGGSPEDPCIPSQSLRFSVSDTGIGIPLDKRRKIFQAFEQEDNSTTRRYGGTGLGLAIASRLVALMHGAIDVESELGRGSTFHFTARFGLQPEQPDRPLARPLVELQGLRVLVVNDNATNRQILEGWFRGWRTEPTVVSDGLEALDALWRRGLGPADPAGGARCPDARHRRAGPGRAHPPESRALADPDHPVDLRRPPRRGRPLPRAGDRRLCDEARPAGRAARDHLPGALAAGPDRGHRRGFAWGVGQGWAAAVAAPPSTSGARFRILLAEDNILNQQLVNHLLRRRGHDVVVARDGRKALEALDHSTFDLMLLDIQMPEFDGFQVIELLRQREQTAGGHLPVVALTAHAMKGDRERCLRAGMDDYLSKPIRAAELFAVIDRVKGGPVASESPLPPTEEPEDLIDPDTLLAACDDDPVLLGTLVRVFRNNLPDSLDRVRQAIARDRPADLRESAHQLRRPGRDLLAPDRPGRGPPRGDRSRRQPDDAASAFEALADLLGRLGPSLDDLPIEELRERSRRMPK